MWRDMDLSCAQGSVWAPSQVTPGRWGAREISPLKNHRTYMEHWRFHTTRAVVNRDVHSNHPQSLSITQLASRTQPPTHAPRVPELESLGWGPGMNMCNKCQRRFSLKFENYCSSVLELLLASETQGQFLWNKEACHRNPTKCQLGNCSIYYCKAPYSCLEWISYRAHSERGQYAPKCNRWEWLCTDNELQIALIFGCSCWLLELSKRDYIIEEIPFLSLLSNTCI